MVLLLVAVDIFLDKTKKFCTILVWLYTVATYKLIWNWWLVLCVVIDLPVAGKILTNLSS